MNLQDLAKPFQVNEIQWRAGATNADKTKALALAYIDARAVMDRLDEVCGQGGWQNELRFGNDGMVIAGIGIKIGDAWVWKWDGSGQTDFEGEKGGISGAIKRAAVHWGIGRYLYGLDGIWWPCEQRGKSIVLTGKPTLPSWAQPEGSKGTEPEKPKADPKPKEPKVERPYPAMVLKQKVADFAKVYRNKQERATETDRKIVAAALDTIFDKDSTKRYELCGWLVGEQSTKKMGSEYILALKTWLGAESFGSEPNPHAKVEAQRGLAVATKEAQVKELL